MALVFLKYQSLQIMLEFYKKVLCSQKLGLFFSFFPREKTTFQWSKVVSEAILPTNQGYISIEKWS